jgi:hypothetical protein
VSVLPFLKSGTSTENLEKPSQVGIELSSIGFTTYSGDILVASVASNDGVTLSPQSTSNLSLAGRLLPQDSDDGLNAVSEMFNNFIHGKDTALSVHGDSAGDGSVRYSAQYTNQLTKLLYIGFMAQ